MKKAKKLAIASLANKTVPLVNFLKVNSKEDSDFEIVILDSNIVGSCQWERTVLPCCLHKEN